MIFPSLVLISIYPWNFKTCLNNWKVREKRYFPIFAINYWLFIFFIGLALLMYFGGMFEVVRTGGTYTGWDTNTSPLVIASLGALFSIMWFPLWFIPLRKRDFLLSHIQAFAAFFTILAFFMSLDRTASAWFMIPLCIIDVFMWIFMWRYEEDYVAIVYKGPDLNF